jgi:hypothetical protein
VALMATAVGSGAAAADEVDGTQDIVGTGDVASSQDASSQDASSQDASNQDASNQDAGNQEPDGAQDVFLHNVVYRARVTGLARGALVGYRISDTQINSASPVTKVGNEVASKTNTDELVSGQRFLNLAAIMPSPIPTVSQSNSAPIANEIVIGSASRIMSVTQAFSLNEYPNDGAGQVKAALPAPYVRPANIPERNSQYCS